MAYQDIINYDSLNQNFAQQGQSTLEGIGSAVEAEAEKRKQAEIERVEQERKDFQHKMVQAQFAESQMKLQESLMVPANTGVNSMDVAIQGASRQLVDAASELQNGLRNGDITPDEWATRMAQIRAQVPGIKNFKDTLQANMKQYGELGAEGLSSAMDASTVDFYGTLMDAKGGELTLGFDPESGEVTFGGTTNNGEPVSIPVSGIAQMPKPMAKVAEPYETLKPTFTEYAQAQSQWTPDMDAVAEQELVKFLGGNAENVDASNKNLLSLAVDRFGIPLEDAKAMINQTDEDGGNELYNAVSGKWMEKAQTAFNATVIDRQKKEAAIRSQQLRDQIAQRNMELAEQRESRLAQQTNSAVSTKNAINAQTAAHRDEYMGRIGKAIANNDVNQFSLQNGFQVERNDDGTYIVYDPKTDKDVALDLTADELNDYVLEQYKSPFKRTSPLKRIKNAWDALTK